PLTMMRNFPLSETSGAFLSGAAETIEGVKNESRRVNPGVIPPSVSAKRRELPRNTFSARLLPVLPTFCFMRPPLERFPALESVQRRVAVRYWSRRDNPQAHKTAGVRCIV